MPEWETYNTNILLKEIRPDQLATRSGFQVYDNQKRTNPLPSHYGIIITTRQTQRQMLKDGINGGYSFLRRNPKQDCYVTLLQEEDDYKKAKSYEHFAIATFEAKTDYKNGHATIAKDNPEIIDLKNGNLKMLLTLCERGVSIVDIASYLSITEIDVCRLYARLAKR